MAQRRSSRSKEGRPSSGAEQASEQSTYQLASIELGLAHRIATDAPFRERYLRRWAANEVATELRRVRKLRRMLQATLAAKAGTGQPAISRIEKEDYDGWTFKTLFSIALALDARLRIRLEPIEDVIRTLQRHEETTVDGPVTATSASSAALLGEGQTVGEPTEGAGTAPVSIFAMPTPSM